MASWRLKRRPRGVSVLGIAVTLTMLPETKARAWKELNPELDRNLVAAE